MRAAIYARYSSDRQSAASIEDQVRLCRDLLDREDWALVQTYADAAVSGATLLRPGIQALIADAMAARVDVVVAEALDRISRDQADVATVVKRLRFAGIRLVTLAEGEITELHVGLKGTMNALYLKDLADKTRRGLRGRVAAGRSGGGNSYGYRLVGGDTGARVIESYEAEVVRRIFRAYAAGQSPRAIAQGLNRERVPGPRGRAWGPSTLNGNAARGTGLLNNELYVGRRVWNRLRYVKDPETGKRVSRLNPEAEWIVTEVPELRIVDDALWQVVKDRQAAVKRNTRPDQPADDAAPPWDRRRPRTLLSGLLVCGACGGGFSKISRHHYGCSTARTKGTCGNRRTIRRDAVEAQVLDGLRHHLMAPDLFKAFCEEFHAELNRQRGTARADLGAKRRERETIQRQARKLVEALKEGTPARLVRDELMALEARDDALAAEIAALEQEAPKPLIHPNLAEVYRQKVAALAEALDHPELGPEAMDLIRSLVDKVVLVPDGDALAIELHGALAGILALCADGKKPASGEAGLLQTELVAGAGFEPATFRL